MTENTSVADENFRGIDYTDGQNQKPTDYPTLDAKLEKGVEVVEIALEAYSNPAILWTGGKDSTLVLYLVAEVAKQNDYDIPPAVFIDHFQHFDVVHEFVDYWADKWDVEMIVARNDSVGTLADAPGDRIRVDELNERNKHEVRNVLKYEDDDFPFLLDTLVGNHLLKTVALNDTLEEYGFDGIITGVRWDEQAARADETFFSPRQDAEKYPPHDRIHPILQFEERAVWDAMWTVVVPDSVPGYPAGHQPRTSTDLPEGIAPEDLPINPKYFEGFRSLGSEVSTTRSADQPAWVQDLDSTGERDGRAQDKEGLMERLRDLGYM